MKATRMYGYLVHRTTDNDLLQLDYIEVTKADSDVKCTIMLYEGNSIYCHL